jgi:hypothetical protein
VSRHEAKRFAPRSSSACWDQDRSPPRDDPRRRTHRHPVEGCRPVRGPADCSAPATHHVRSVIRLRRCSTSVHALPTDQWPSSPERRLAKNASGRHGAAGSDVVDLGSVRIADAAELPGLLVLGARPGPEYRCRHCRLSSPTPRAHPRSSSRTLDGCRVPRSFCR